MVLRALVETRRDDVEIVLINTPGPVETSAHLYEFDSIHGRAQGSISHGEGWMDVGRGRIAMTHERDPAMIPHADHGVAVRGEGLIVVCGGSDCGVLPTVTFLGVRDVVCLRCGCEDWS